MTATLVAEGTIAASIPGVYAALVATGVALRDLEGVVDANIAALNAVASLELQAEIDANVTAINASYGASLDAQISGGLTASADLSAITDAAAWLSGTIADLNATIALLGTLDAALHLDGTIAAVDAGISANTSLRANLNVDLDMPDVQASLNAVANISATLTIAINAAVPGLVAYAEIISKLASAGIVIVHYSGQVQDFGTDCDAAIATSSLGASDNSTAVALLVSSSNPTAEANFKFAFGIS